MRGDRQSHVDLKPILRNRVDRLSSVIACKRSEQMKLTFELAERFEESEVVELGSSTRRVYKRTQSWMQSFESKREQ